jgi:hypothetical protein
MPGTFVPFFEKTSDETLPEYQFTQFRPDRLGLGHTPSRLPPSRVPPPPAPSAPLEDIAPDFDADFDSDFEPEAKAESADDAAPEQPPAPQKIRCIDRQELNAKLQSDLRNAVALELPDEQIQLIKSDLAKLRHAPEGTPGPDGEIPEQQPNIRLEKDGDKVTSISVECDCGQIIELDCVY